MLHIITYATHSERLIYLQKSAKRYNVNVKIIFLEKWKGFKSKVFDIIRYCDKLNEDDIVCIIDAYDILINKSLDQLESDFKSKNCDMIIGSELNIFPSFANIPIENKIHSNYKYANGGFHIGYAKKVYELFTWKNKLEIKEICDYGTDQYYIYRYLHEHDNKINIILDYKCEFVQNMCGAKIKDFELQDYHLKNNIMNTVPYFIHFSGKSYLAYKNIENNTNANLLKDFSDYDFKDVDLSKKYVNIDKPQIIIYDQISSSNI